MLSRRRRLVFTTVITCAVMLGSVGTLLATDMYLHRRVQNLGGVNMWGYRGPVVGKKKPDEMRIVAIGGSTAFCFGVPWNEAWPHYLETALNRQQPANAHRFSVVNLGAPGEGAYAFQFELEDFAYLQYDVAVLYEGYNDLGERNLPEGIPPRSGPNYFLWRRQSPVFRLTGYLPILPLVFREKAMALMAGGDLDAAYRGRVTFRPGLATRATAMALQTAATLADRVGAQLGHLSDDPSRVAGMAAAGEVETWRHYVESVTQAVGYARARRVKVLVVTQPYGSDTHIRQQQVLASALADRFGGDHSVRYVNLGPLLNLRDREIAFDGLHLVARANENIAAQLLQPVLELSMGTSAKE